MIFHFFLLAFTSGSILVTPPSPIALSKSQIAVRIGFLVYDCLARSSAPQSNYFECIKRGLPKDPAVREFLFEDFTLERSEQNFSSFIIDQKMVSKSLKIDVRPVESVYFEIMVASIFLRDMVHYRDERSFGARHIIRMLMLLLIDDIRDMVFEDIAFCLESIEISKSTENYEMRSKIANHLALLVNSIDEKPRKLVCAFITRNFGEAIKRMMFSVFTDRKWLAHPNIKKDLKSGFFFDNGPKRELFIEENWELFLKSPEECFIYLIRLNGKCDLLERNQKGIISLNLKEESQVTKLFIFTKKSQLQTAIIVNELEYLLENSRREFKFFLDLHEICYIQIKKRSISWNRRIKPSGDSNEVGDLLYKIYGPRLLTGGYKFAKKNVYIMPDLARLLNRPAKVIESPVVWEVLNNPKEFFHSIHFDYFLLRPKFQIAIAVYLLNCYTYHHDLSFQDQNMGNYFKVLSLYLIPKNFKLLDRFLTEERIRELLKLLVYDPNAQDEGCSKFCGLICSLFEKKKIQQIPEEENRLERISALLNNVDKDVAEAILGSHGPRIPFVYLKPYFSKGLPFFNQLFFLQTSHYFIKPVISFHLLSNIIIFADNHLIGLNGGTQIFTFEIDSHGEGQIASYRPNQLINLIPVKYILFFNSPRLLAQLKEPEVHKLISFALKKLESEHQLAKFILFNMQLNCIQVFKNEKK
jgi:hypothetical protein